MREYLRQLVLNARRMPATDPAQRCVGSPCEPFSIEPAASLAADAVRLARIASTMHLDQAANLRVRMAEWNRHQFASASAAAQPTEAGT